MPNRETPSDQILWKVSPWVDLLRSPLGSHVGFNLLPNPDGICRNSWEKNQFGTEIGVPGCIGTSVVLDEKDVCALNDDHDD